MKKNKSVNSFPNFFVLIFIFLFSCEENKSLVIEPIDNLEYEFKVFKLDNSISNTFREIEENAFHSGLSSRIYAGNIIDFIDNSGNQTTKNSKIILKIKNDLIRNNIFCSEEPLSINNIQLKLPTITDTENLYFTQFSNYDNLHDCTSFTDEDDCIDYSHCYWFEEVDFYNNEVISQCNFKNIGNSGDYEHVANNPFRAYLLNNPSGFCSEFNEESPDIHDESFLDDCNLDDSIDLPVTVSGTYDYITIDLKGYLYSEINYELNNENVDCSQFNYEECLCLLWTTNQEDNDNECLTENYNNDCYWQGSPSTGTCNNEQNSNISMDLDSWCSNDGESNTDDFIIILEYNPLSNDNSAGLLQLYSSDEEYLYNNPYLYLNYNIEENNFDEIKKYQINSISSNYIDNLLCSGGDCNNLDEDNDVWGTVLSFDLNLIQDYLTLLDEDLENDSPNIENCNLLDQNTCSDYLYCLYDNNLQECQFSNVFPNLISADYEGELLRFDIELDSENIDSFNEIVFHLNNLSFIYADDDPTGDNYEEGINDGGSENNLMWDWNDIDEDQTLDILSEEYELFDDFGIDGCSDEYETANEWDGYLNNCSDNTFNNKYDCLCVEILDIGPYNPNGTENNNSLDWDDVDENLIWSDYEEGEKWYDTGYDQVDDFYESGCFNDDNPYGGTNLCWTDSESSNSLCSYESILSEWFALDESNTIENLDIYTMTIIVPNMDDIGTSDYVYEVSICGTVHWQQECEKCFLNDPNGDNYNIDPSNDNYDEDEFPLNPEGNDKWDGPDIVSNGICEIGECEMFFDYGLDGLPDIYENYDYIVEDNWFDCGTDGDCSIIDDNNTQNNNIWDEGEGTEGNNRWDYKDLNFNGVFDIEYDLYEQFFDYGVDQVISNDEEGSNGEIYNSTGKQGNLSYNEFSGYIFYEKFEDCGIDGDCNDNNLVDDFNIDPNQDNYDPEFYPENKEKDNQLDWSDLDENLIWSSYDEGERWYDFGFDHIQNQDEVNYMADYANLALGTNNYVLNLDNQTTSFSKPSTNSDDQLIIWISEIIKNDLGENNYTVIINVHSFIDIAAFQFQLIHDLLQTETVTIDDKTLLLFPHEFIDSDENLFPSQTELVENGEKYIIDASLYTLNSIPENLNLNYAYGLKDSLNFISDDGITLEDFFNENNNSIISDEHTNLIMYFDNSKINHYIFENSKIQLEYYDYNLDEFIIYDDTQIFNNEISDSIDSLRIDIAPLIQKYIIGEIDYNSIILSLSDDNNNFSNVLLLNDQYYKPRLEIFYSK